jgi:hypothetical protein
MSIRGEHCGMQETEAFAAGFGVSATAVISLGSSQLLGELLLLIGP